jgi:hypothetical protein
MAAAVRRNRFVSARATKPILPAGHRSLAHPDYRRLAQTARRFPLRIGSFFCGIGRPLRHRRVSSLNSDLLHSDDPGAIELAETLTTVLSKVTV